jgi:hypothetical protein
MFRKSFLILFAMTLILVVKTLNANPYYFASTDGTHLFLFEVTIGSDGKPTIDSQFQYDAPGRMGSTALVPAPQSTASKLVFDLFGTFDKPGKPVVFRDRLELDLATRTTVSSATWRLVSRKKFNTYKVTSYNFISASATADERFLLTQNGTTVNKKKITPTGKLTGKNIPVIKNPSGIFPYNGSISPDGEFVVQAFTAISAKGTEDAQVATTQEGLSIVRIKDGQIVNLATTKKLLSLCAASHGGKKCFGGSELTTPPSAGASDEGASAAAKTRDFYVQFDFDPFHIIGKSKTIQKPAATTLNAYDAFNTTVIVPDGTLILFGKQKDDKLEFYLQGLNGSCGLKLGPAQKFLTQNDGVIKNNLPLYAWAAAKAWCAQVGLC